MKINSNKNVFWFIFQNDRLLLGSSTADQRLIDSTSIHDLEPFIIRRYQLSALDNHDIYCAELNIDSILPVALEAIPLRKALEIIGQDWYTIAVKAYMIINWDKNHQFCGRCGSDTTHKPGTFERACPLCDIVFYPRISPSIIVCILHHDKILMARSYHFASGVFGLIAGFVEPGESVEDAVHREVMEEVGITITDLTYFGSQAWPFPDSLMLGFTASYVDGVLDINNNEIEAAGWYRYDELPGRPSSTISISGKLLDHGIALLKDKYEK